MSRPVLTGLGLVAIVACARMGSPAGGPDDAVAPKLVGTIPESLGVYPDWRHDVEFRFDEVVSEGGSPNIGLGTGDLERLVLLSPARSIPVVRWKRDRITVHPREGWHRDRVYRVQLLPGLSDLRRNKSDTTAVLTFSTGGGIPSDTLAGLVIDWVSGRVARAALVELLLAPDSLVYRTVTDSGGRYRIGPLPRGRWTVFGIGDQNHNLRRDRREQYDSVEVADSVLRIPTLWLIPRDTVGPKIQTLALNDSLSATITFSQPLDPTQRFDSLDVRFRRLPDSTPVAFRSLRPKALDDSLQKIIAARADSIRRQADTTRTDSTVGKPARTPTPAQPPRGGPAAPAKVDAEADSILHTRPALFDKLILRVDTAFTPEGRYQLEVHGIRSAAGVAGDGKSVLAIPKAKPPVPLPADSTAQPADSSAVSPRPAKPKPRQ